ncbi:MAG TPA: Clp protease N-terminal domain-containing protein, partial [Candidatus Limnocylindrales bacterium]|nr:Clp protease N-terminal domain-containing protein [Candidatus Limnocylindrales bacterium]
MFERFTDRARQVPKAAQDQARQLGHGFIGTEHLLLALLALDGGIAHDVLIEAGASYARVRAGIQGVEHNQEDVLDDAEALESIGIDLNAVKAKLEEAFGPGVLDPPPPERRGWFGRRRRSPGVAFLHFTPRSKKVLELALREALALKHKHIGTEHLLLGLIREEGMAAKLLYDQGIN